MAVLSRRDTDGGFYTRINIGGIATRQVHPDAVRYLNKRGVYVGDEIPTELMRKLRSTKNWLYTKEELPFVVFTEHADPWFGMRSAPPGRSSVRGTTQVVASGPLTPAKKRRNRRSPKQSNSVRVSKDSGTYLDQKPDPASWSEPIKPPAYPDLVAAAVAESESVGSHDMSASAVHSSRLLSANESRGDVKAEDHAPYLNKHDATAKERTSEAENTPLAKLREWYFTGADLPLWAVLLIFVVIVAAMGLATFVMDGIG